MEGKLFGLFNQNIWLSIFLSILGIAGLYQMFITFGWLIGLMYSFIPIMLMIMLWLLQKPYWMYIIVFIINYFVTGIARYIPIAPGITMDILLIIIVVFLLFKSAYKPVKWKRGLNGLTAIAFIWLFYCILELFNPQVVSMEAWATSIRGIAVYFFILAFLTPIVFYRYKDLKRILLFWSALTLIAVFKALWQKFVDFDSFEKLWLYESGGATTHIINTGIRYFSFYSDAANYGTGMGFSLIVFSIAAFYIKNSKLKIYFLFVAIAAGYGMLLSGTRSALAVPFAGLGLYIILSKNVKSITIGLIFLISAFFFLNFTYIGQENSYVRRMRSAFNTEDASFQVRLNNQTKIRTYMADKPFGVGLGLGGTKAQRYAPNSYLSQIPTDSWFVMIWVETGITGLVIHLFVLFYVVIYGSYISMYKLKNNELKGIHNALLAGIFGMMAASYGNEIFGQFPNGFIVYISQSFIFMALSYDKELENDTNNYTPHELHS